VLWIGGASAVAGRTDSVTFDLTDPGGASMLDYAIRRTSRAETYATRAVASIIAERTNLGGRLLAPLGVREIIVRPDASPSVVGILERQSDLEFRENFGGARVFDNTAWLPVAAPVSGALAATAAAADPFARAPAGGGETPPRGLAMTGPAAYAGQVPAASSALLLAEPFDGHWRLRVPGSVLRPTTAFGFANVFALPSRREAVAARISWDAQRYTRALLLAELALWVLFGAWWSRRAAVERGER
jgi:hypothetical protein